MSKDRCPEMVGEVLFDILLYLPVISLLRFKAVCKYWSSIIESSTFISEHLNHNQDNEEDDFIIFSRKHGRDDRLSCKQEFRLLFGSQSESVYDIDSWRLWHPESVAIAITNCCNGIVCLAFRNEIALWNPILKQLRPLPPPQCSNRLGPGKQYSVYTSFGIDVKSNDYKLVRILLLYGDTPIQGHVFGNQVEVYRLAGDNSWRTIYKDEVLPFDDIYSFDTISSGKSGKCFWIATHNYTRILLSFDFSDDVFSTTPLPHGNQNHSQGYNYNLDLVDDKDVCIMEIIFYEHGGDNKNIEIWMLHEFGEEKSWNMMYKIGQLSFFDFFPRGISKNGKLLLCSKSNMFYLYNLQLTQQGKYHQNINLKCLPYQGQFIQYHASLLPLKSDEQCDTVATGNRCTPDAQEGTQEYSSQAAANTSPGISVSKLLCLKTNE